MTLHPALRGLAFVTRVHGGMVVLALVVALAVAVFVGLTEALAAFIGGIAVVLPQNFVARRLLQPMAAIEATRFVSRLWLFQSVKWLSSALMLAAALVYFKAHAVYVLSGFIIVFQGLWIVPLVFAGIDHARTGKS